MVDTSIQQQASSKLEQVMQSANKYLKNILSFSSGSKAPPENVNQQQQQPFVLGSPQSAKPTDSEPLQST